MSGIRFLDIRVKKYPDGYFIIHDIIKFGRLEDVIRKGQGGIVFTPKKLHFGQIVILPFFSPDEYHDPPCLSTVM